MYQGSPGVHMLRAFLGPLSPEDVDRLIGNKEFGRRLRYAREAQGFSQAGVAKRMDVTKNAVSNWEQGHCYPGMACIDDLCIALRVTPNWLFRPVDQTR